MYRLIVTVKFVIQIFQTVISEDNITEAVMPIAAVLVLILYIFFANFFGQYVTDHNNEIYDVA
jgi:hypothetical protein